MQRVVGRSDCASRFIFPFDGQCRKPYTQWAHFDFAERLRMCLFTLCRANGLIVTQENRYSLTPLAEEFLCDDSAWNLRPYYTPIQDSQIMQDFLTVPRTGKPANWRGMTPMIGILDAG